MILGTSEKLRVIANAVLFQLGWFTCVFGAARGQSFLAVAATIVIIGLNLCLVPRAWHTVRLIVVATLIGATWESVLRMAGLMVYEPLGPQALAPDWIVALWALFATTLELSLRWLQGRWLLAAAFGAVGGPLSYLAGQRLGALQIPVPTFGLPAQALGWAIILPVLLYVAQAPHASTRRATPDV